MVELKINKRILDKLNELDESEDFKQILKDSLIFEKDQAFLGDTEYTKKYAGFVARISTDDSISSDV